MKINQQLIDDDDGTVDSFVKTILPCSDGNTYLFSSTSGKIWKRESDATYTLIHTNSEGAILGAEEYSGWIYYASSSGKLGRVAISDTTWAEAEDDWATFTNKDPEFKPMKKLNGILYIGDGFYVSQVEDSKFNAIGTITSSGTTVTGTNTAFTDEAKVNGKIFYTDDNNYTQARTIVSISDDDTLEIDSAFSPEPTTRLFQLSNHVFSADALDLETDQRIKSLGTFNTGLLIGSFVSNNVSKSAVYLWNTWSVSFSSELPIPEVGVNAFIEIDNATIFSAGKKGSLYMYQGTALGEFKNIPGDWGIGKEAFVHPNATANFGGIPLFGVSNGAGNPATCGVYSYARNCQEYSNVLNIEYIISTGETTGIEIGAIAVVGDVFLVSWKKDSTYGIDRLDVDAKLNGARMESRVMMIDRNQTGRVGKINVLYRTLPERCSIEVYCRKNNGEVKVLKTHNNIDKSCVTTMEDVENVATFEVGILVNTPGGNQAPEIEAIEVNINEGG